MENEIENKNKKFYMPFVLCTHKMGIKYGDFVAPIFSTLEELRKWYPEPQKYVEMYMVK